MLDRHHRRRIASRVCATIVSLTLLLIMAACGGDPAPRPTATAPAGQESPASPEAASTQVPANEASPTVVPSEATPPLDQPLPVAEDGAQALANLEQAMTRPGHVFHATLAQVNTGAISDPDRVTPVWSAEVWTDMEQARGRVDYRLDPDYVDPASFGQSGSASQAPTTIYAGNQVYRSYDAQIWVSVTGPCLGMDRPSLAVAFICDLAALSGFGWSAFGPREEDGELYLERGAEFEGRPALALSVGQTAMVRLCLDPDTYLPLGWEANQMESGTRITTIASDFIPSDTLAEDLLDPASVGVQPRPTLEGRILLRRDIITTDTSEPEVFIINADGSGEINLSDSPGWDLGASWSPDGQRVAFSSEREGNAEIYVIDSDGSGLTKLTSSPTGEWGPLWSPDGTRILFESDRDGTNLGELYVMDADGTNVLRLSPLDNLQWPAWSPDGRRIAFASEAGVRVVNADGTGETQITTTGGSSVLNWTPDGSRLIFASRATGNSDIFAVNSDGSGLTNLTDHPADDSWPILSPDGQRMLFNSDRDNPGGSRDGYVMNIDGSQPTPLTYPPSTSTCETGCDWSPDGEQIVVTLLNQTGLAYTLAIVSADGRLVTVLTGVEGYSPQWSPEPSATAP